MAAERGTSKERSDCERAQADTRGGNRGRGVAATDFLLLPSRREGPGVGTERAIYT